MRRAVRIGLVQVDPTIGAMEENGRLLLDGFGRAVAGGAELAVSSELALPGYPPTDLFERPDFVTRLERAEHDLVTSIPGGLVAVFGSIEARRESEGRPFHNVAVVAERGRVILRAQKALLPVYDVFDEGRYFEPATDASRNLFELKGIRIGVTICEDLWNDRELWPRRLYRIDPVEALVAQGIQGIVNLSSSPFSVGRDEVRRGIVRHAAQRHGVFVAYANQVGANDGLVFDGASMIFDAGGRELLRLPSFRPDVGVTTTEATMEGPLDWAAPREAPAIEQIHDALILGISDFFEKLRIETAVVAVSGGIDSAVVTYLASVALGRDRVKTLSLPSRYSSKGSIDDAAALTSALGVEMRVLSIEPMLEASLRTLDPILVGRPPGLTEENLQSRLRGVLVMAYANELKAVALTTGNKSESAVGYCTLYGDTCGGLAPIADLYKNQVYALARYANARAGRELIPESSITKAPSAELRPNQRDEDSLPPYDALDEELRLMVEERLGIEEISTRSGRPIDEVRRVVGLVHGSEFKRRQYPPTLRVSSKAWVGREYPIAHRFRER